MKGFFYYTFYYWFCVWITNTVVSLL